MKKGANKLTKMNDVLFERLDALNDKDLIKNGLSKKEVERSNAICKTASTIIKSITTTMKIKQFASQNRIKEKELLNELGVLTND